jgi:hypothetical protein
MLLGKLTYNLQYFALPFSFHEVITVVVTGGVTGVRKKIQGGGEKPGTTS